MNSTMKFRERVEIKPSCADCPMLARFEVLYDELEHNAREILEAAMSGDIERQLIASYVSDGVDEHEAREIVQSHHADIHKENVDAVMQLDKRTEASATLAEKLLDSCRGSLEMCESRYGCQIVVTVCLSEMMDIVSTMGGGDVATIKRERAED